MPVHIAWAFLCNIGIEFRFVYQRIFKNEKVSFLIGVVFLFAIIQSTGDQTNFRLHCNL